MAVSRPFRFWSVACAFAQKYLALGILSGQDGTNAGAASHHVERHTGLVSSSNIELSHGTDFALYSRYTGIP